MPTITRKTQRYKRLPWLLPDDTVVPDACWDSHGNRLMRAKHGFPTLARAMSACFDPKTGTLDMVSLLFEHLDLQDGNPWLPDHNRAARADLNDFAEFLRQEGKQPGVPMLLNLERQAGGHGTLHDHGQAPGWVGRLIVKHLGEDAIFTASSGRRVWIGEVRPLDGGKEIGDLWTYEQKVADADAICWQGRKAKDWRAGQRRSMKRRQEACDARRNEGLFRLPSTRIKIDLPVLPRLTSRQLRALRRVLRGSAPAIPARNFIAYLDAVADWSEGRVQPLVITLLALALPLLGSSQRRADEAFIRMPSRPSARGGRRAPAHRRRVGRAREPP
ncbi:hypothetical protein [Deinococcus sonorensis]|uniref:Uncharacterized protein n=2 Tax=Deinococcus sonorensis TaxID=309891 RepID=A0AAU7UG55_9DEIO